ncbi:MAG: carboxypeptidase regulatory-like domain-containing protein [Acidobacteriota bacterium]
MDPRFIRSGNPNRTVRHCPAGTTIPVAEHPASARLAWAIVRLLMVSLFTLALGGTLRAQQQTAEITGIISDGTGAIIPGASVTVAEPSRGIHISVHTDSRGGYVVPLLPPGADYEVQVSKAGFQTAVRSGITLVVSQVARIDMALQVGQAAQTVTVSGAPPLLDTETSSVGQVLPAHTIANLALNGRSTFRLIQLTPGVTFNRAANGIFGDVPSNTTFDTNLSINGERAQSNEFLIDGVPSTAGFFDQITTIPTVDDTQEFKVESDNLPAEYGRFAGGVINVTTKQGSNQFHGNIFEFLRNSALDANEYFNKGAGLSIPPFKMNQYGFSAGGPVLIPRIYNGHNKTFFFVSYQGTSRIQGVTFQTTVPTAAERQGDFSGLMNAAGKPITIYNPFSTQPDPNHPGQYIRTAFQGNKISSSLWDPVAQNLIKFYPQPNKTGANFTNANNFISNAPLTLNQNAGSARLDEYANDTYRLFGRLGWMLTTQTQPNTYGNLASPGQGAIGTTKLDNWSFSQNNTFTLSPNLLFTLNYGYARWYQIRQTLSYGFNSATLGFPSSLTSNIQIPMFPTLQMVAYGNMSGQSYLSNGNDSHALLSSLTWIHGRHTVVVGTDVRMHFINIFNALASSGTYSFTRAPTQGPNPVTVSPTAGDAMASLLLGAGSGGSIPISAGNSLKDFYFAGYAQDTFQVTPKLTIDAGLRYETESPYTDRHNRLNYFDPSMPSPAANSQFPNLTGGLIFAGVDGQPSNVYVWNTAQFDPRVGLSYSLNQSTVFRGGFGTVYAPLEISNNAVGYAPSTGFSSTSSWVTSVDGGLTPYNLLSNPYPNGLVQPTGSTAGAGTQLGQSISFWDHNPQSPQSYEWNVGVQRQFPWSTLLDVSYVGTRGIHLTAPFDLNQLNPSYLSLGTALQQPVANPFQSDVKVGLLSQPKVPQQQLLRPYPQYTGVTIINSTWGGSNYQALQVKLNKRTSHGVDFLLAYTYSKWLSNVQNAEAPIGPSNTTNVQNYYDLAAEKSLSETDTPNSLIANVVAQLPFGRGQLVGSNLHGLPNALVSGWNASAIVIEQSGWPLAFFAPVTGLGNRPNAVAGVEPHLSGSRSNGDKVDEWFNTSAFSLPAAYTLGNIGRTDGAVRGPGIHNIDFSLERDFPIHENWHAQFRVEAFNLFNTPHFNMPDTSMNTPLFGHITNTILSPPPRELQGALQVFF